MRIRNCLKMKNITCLSQRHLMAIMALTGLVNAYLMRLCLNLTILKMANSVETKSLGTYEQIKYTHSSMMDITQIVTLSNSEEKLDWSPEIQGLIKSSFFIGYALVHIPASFLGQKYGGGTVLNIGLFLTAICTLLTPCVVKIGGSDGLIVLRFIMGVGEAPAYPALIYLLSNWIPLKERGRVSSIVFTGGQLGTVIVYLISGFILENIEGWAIIFYIFGGIGLIWNVAFYFLVYDTPWKNKRISAKEKEYLKKEIGEMVETKGFFQIPWTSMLTSPPVLALIIAQMGHDWGFYMLVSEMATYLHNIIRLKYDEKAMYIAAACSSSYIFSLMAGAVCDYIVTKKYVSLTRARQIFTAIGALVSATFMILIPYAEYNRPAVLAFFILAVCSMGAFYTGAQANFLDLCPNYSGALMGLVNGTGAVCGFLVPFVTGILTENAHTSSDWIPVFWTSFTVLSVTVLAYLIWGSAKVQSWNDNDEDDWMKRVYRRFFVRKTTKTEIEKKTDESEEILSTETDPQEMVNKS